MSLAKQAVVGVTKPFRLVFHIGAGKTGTTSIQMSLKQAIGVLKNHGCDYWGVMLESAPVNLYGWQQDPNKWGQLVQNPELGCAEVEEVLVRSINASQADGIHTAIWSHEWFFDRPQTVIPALKAIESQGVRVEVIAYVRRHDAWAKSAYVQWGIKHKTYSGPLWSFKDYVSKRPVRFEAKLQPWLDAFHDTFMLRNFDATDDVVQDFLSAGTLPKDISSIRMNDTPRTEELLLRALYNNTIEAEVLPMNFNHIFQVNNVNFDLEPLSWLSSLLPTDSDLAELIDISSEDREYINRLLASNGQLPIDVEPRHSNPLSVDKGKMLGIMFQIIIHQAKKLQRLQRDHRKLSDAFDKLSTENDVSMEWAGIFLDGLLDTANKIANTPSPDTKDLDSLRSDLAKLELRFNKDVRWIKASVFANVASRSEGIKTFKLLQRLNDVLGPSHKEEVDAFYAEVLEILYPMTLGPHGFHRTIGDRQFPHTWEPLLKFIELIDELGYTWFANSGTLLGLVREGALIAHDDDLDIALLFKGHTPDEVRREAEELLRTLYSHGCELHYAKTKIGMRHWKLAQAGFIDIFPAWIDEQERLYIWPHTCGELTKDDLFPLEYMQLGQMHFPVPQNKELMLEQNYGPDWRVPNPLWHFDWQKAEQKFHTAFPEYFEQK